MQFTRIISFFAVLFAFGAFALAVPTKRASTADIETILTTLKTSIQPTLASINSTVASGSASDDTIQPLISDLTGSLDTASASLSGLVTAKRAAGLETRQSEADIATLVAEIVEDITSALDTLLGDISTSVPLLGELLAGVDTSLDQVLVGLETLLAGVLTLVANLLVDVAGLLQSLALGLTLASLGL